MKSPSLAASVSLAFAAAASAGVFFTNETAFVAAIQPTYYLEDFGSFSYGNPLDGLQTNYPAPGGNGFGWTASATNGLYSLVSALSVNAPDNPFTITFSGNTVTAIGGLVANSDFSGNPIPGTVTITTSDGGSQSNVLATAAEVFLGYTSTVPISSITLSATSGALDNFIRVDHFYTGTASPPRINKLTLLNGSNRLDAINLPPGNSIAVESSTNLQTWATNATVTVTNPTQTIFIPATNVPRHFFRLHL